MVFKKKRIQKISEENSKETITNNELELVRTDVDTEGCIICKHYKTKAGEIIIKKDDSDE